MFGVLHPLVLPHEGGELRKGRSEKPTASQREPCPFLRRWPVVFKTDVQHVDAVGVFDFSEGFELEVPFARIGFVGQQPFPTPLVARTTRVNPADFASIHCNVQRNRVTSLHACLDETSTILSCDGYRGPHPRLIDQRHPPESANVCQLQKVVQAVSGVGRGGELEDPEEDFDGDAVDGTTFWER